MAGTHDGRNDSGIVSLKISGEGFVVFAGFGLEKLLQKDRFGVRVKGSPGTVPGMELIPLSGRIRPEARLPLYRVDPWSCTTDSAVFR